MPRKKSAGGFEITRMMPVVLKVCNTIANEIEAQTGVVDRDGLLHDIQGVISHYGRGNLDSVTASVNEKEVMVYVAKPKYNMAADILCLAIGLAKNNKTKDAMEAAYVALCATADIDDLASGLTNMNQMAVDDEIPVDLTTEEDLDIPPTPPAEEMEEEPFEDIMASFIKRGKEVKSVSGSGDGEYTDDITEDTDDEIIGVPGDKVNQRVNKVKMRKGNPAVKKETISSIKESRLKQGLANRLSARGDKEGKRMALMSLAS